MLCRAASLFKALNALEESISSTSSVSSASNIVCIACTAASLPDFCPAHSWSEPQASIHTFRQFLLSRVSQGFWGTREHWQNIEGNKGTLANFWEQGNKIRKFTVRKNLRKCLGTWEHRAILGTREQGLPPGRPSLSHRLLLVPLHIQTYPKGSGDLPLGVL